jgi:adenylate cyclase
LLATAGSVGSFYLVTAVERERVRELFTRFVPEEIVGQVLARTDGDLRLGGEKLMATMLFVDLRGFTTFAERTAAEDAVTILNFYLEQMSDAVLNQGGTLVTYRGDGLMAAFGAPIEVADHADRALAAARDMVGDRLAMFNKWLHDRGVEKGFRIGVGLNSGNVMSGNVGHERRLEYTTIGDAVNTAARIEEMTKGQPHMLFLSETTYDALSSPPPDLVFVDEVAVRGREKGIKIWGYEPPASPYAPPVPGSEPPAPAPAPETAAEPAEVAPS